MRLTETIKSCAPRHVPSKDKVTAAYFNAMADYRVWLMFVIYGACFGIELLVNGSIALYFVLITLVTSKTCIGRGRGDRWFDRVIVWPDEHLCPDFGWDFWRQLCIALGFAGRATWLFIVLLGEGLALMLFSQMPILMLAIPTLIIFSLFTQMSEGATYSVVPFINKKALGAVAGVVGAGGNAGAVLGGFLLKSEAYNSQWNEAYFLIGMIVTGVAFLALFIRFSPEKEAEEKALFESANMDILQHRADEANAALLHSAEVVAEYNRTHEQQIKR